MRFFFLKISSCYLEKLEVGVLCGNELWEMLRLVCFELLKKFVIVYYVVKFKVFWEVFVYFLIYSLRRYDRNGF